MTKTPEVCDPEGFIRLTKKELVARMYERGGQIETLRDALNDATQQIRDAAEQVKLRNDKIKQWENQWANFQDKVQQAMGVMRGVAITVSDDPTLTDLYESHVPGQRKPAPYTGEERIVREFASQLDKLECRNPF